MTLPSKSARPIPVAALYPLIFVAVYLGHFTLLRLPYFWDEGGYYIPAALDFFRTGTLIPQSTITNAHPPLPSILLAGAWHITGYVPSGTRTFICMIAAAALLAVYRLTRPFVGELAAATFTLWALAVYLDPTPMPWTSQPLTPAPVSSRPDRSAVERSQHLQSTAP